MAFLAKRILIITNETKFALDVKKALERNGEFTVSVFSSGKAGIAHARHHQQDVAVVDFRMKDMPGTDMVDNLRLLQRDIAIIAAPNHPAIHDLQDRHNIQRIINIPMKIRKFVA
ncbi:MAG: response regulator, partial [Chloroflexota bacterium]